MRRYYFRIFHKGETHADDVGELFGSAQLAVQYGARVARDKQHDLRAVVAGRRQPDTQMPRPDDGCSSPLTDPGESQLPLHCGMAAVLALTPVLLLAATVRPIAVLGDKASTPI